MEVQRAFAEAERSGGGVCASAKPPQPPGSRDAVAVFAAPEGALTRSRGTCPRARKAVGSGGCSAGGQLLLQTENDRWGVPAPIVIADR